MTDTTATEPTAPEAPLPIKTYTIETASNHTTIVKGTSVVVTEAGLVTVADDDGLVSLYWRPISLKRSKIQPR